MKLGSAFVQTVGLQAVQSVMALVIGVVVARALGPAGQGIYATVLAGVALGAALGVLGQFQGIALVAAERSVSGRVLLMASLLQMAAVAIVFAVTRPVWAPSLGSAATAAPWLITALLATEVLALMLRGIALGQHQILVFSLMTLIQRTLMLMAVAALWWRGGLTLPAVLAIWLVSLCLSLLAGGLAIWFRSPASALNWGAVSASWRRSLGHGGRPLVVLALTLLLVRADIWMLRPMSGVETVGQMAVAIGLAEMLWYLPTIAGNLLFAQVAADRSVTSALQTARGVRLVAGASVTAGIVLVIVGQPLVHLLYGVGYTLSGILFVYLVPGMVAIAIHLVLDSYFGGRGFPPITLWAAFGALATKVLANLLVIPAYGAKGAAITTSMVYIGLLATKVIWFARETGIDYRTILIPTAEDFRRIRDAVDRRLRGGEHPIDIPVGEAR